MDEQDAVKANSMPDAVVETSHFVPTQQEQDENAAANEKVEKYGFSDFEKFMVKLTSNSIFARKVVRDLFGFDQDKPFTVGNIAGSPQEQNITGVLLHTQHPPILKDSNVSAEKPVEKTPEAS